MHQSLTDTNKQDFATHELFQPSPPPMRHNGRICAEAHEGNAVCAGRELASQITHSHACSSFIGLTQEEEDRVSCRDKVWAGGHLPAQKCLENRNLDSSKIIFQKLTHRRFHRGIFNDILPSQQSTNRSNCLCLLPRTINGNPEDHKHIQQNSD